ncbi:hypothetical protein [Microvirga sp. M2]|uniref:hypothetical protein n=1 Tax=Microvirga sp. M2 TaxID=3073270 RepID=UPI0039C09400
MSGEPSARIVRIGGVDALVLAAARTAAREEAPTPPRPRWSNRHGGERYRRTVPSTLLRDE